MKGFGPMSPEEFIKFLTGGGLRAEDDLFEDDGEIICLAKNYPVLQDIKAEADNKNKFIEKRQRDARDRYEAEVKACMQELQNMKKDFWVKIEDYLEKMGLMPDTYRKQIDNLSFENGAIIMSRSKDNRKRDHDGNPI